MRPRDVTFCRLRIAVRQRNVRPRLILTTDTPVSTSDGRNYTRYIRDLGLGRENNNRVGPKTSNYGCYAVNDMI